MMTLCLHHSSMTVANLLGARRESHNRAPSGNTTTQKIGDDLLENLHESRILDPRIMIGLHRREIDASRQSLFASPNSVAVHVLKPLDVLWIIVRPESPRVVQKKPATNEIFRDAAAFSVQYRPSKKPSGSLKSV